MPDGVFAANVYEKALIALHRGDSKACGAILHERLLAEPNDVLLLHALLRLAEGTSVVDGPRIAGQIGDLLNGSRLPYVAAAAGWRYARELEEAFITDADALRVPTGVTEDTDKRTADERLADERTADAKTAAMPVSEPGLDDLAVIHDPRTLFDALRALTRTPSHTMNRDDFAHDGDVAIDDQIAAGFRADTFNVAILGAGPVGLLLAHALRRGLPTKTNVLLVDNRVTTPGLKRPYARDWLTHLAKIHFAGIVDDRIMKIFGRIGAEHYIGAPINVLETLLLLGAREAGVRVLFSDEVAPTALTACATCVFDASGGRVDWAAIDGYESGVDPDAGALTLRQGPQERFGAGFVPFGIRAERTAPPFEAELKGDGLRRPVVNGRVPDIPMVKITGLPAGWLPSIKDHVLPENTDGKFYIWPGQLASEINEGLVLANLEPDLHRLLAAHIAAPTPVIDVVDALGARIEDADRRLHGVLLAIANERNPSCKLEPPFVYAPRIRAAPFGNARHDGTPVFPIGDSLFNGHPKVGTGLSTNLTLVRQIHDVVAATIVAAG